MMSVVPRIHPTPSGFIEPCFPTAARVPPSGPGWLHEIKHDGYRLMARLEGRKVRLFSRALAHPNFEFFSSLLGRRFRHSGLAMHRAQAVEQLCGEN